jgi:hypothetical protein
MFITARRKSDFEFDVLPSGARLAHRLLSAMSVSLLRGLVYLISESGLQKNLIRKPGIEETGDS